MTQPRNESELNEIRKEVQRTLETFHQEGDVVELRISKNGVWGSCYYTAFDDIVNDVLRLEREKHPKYQYFITLNELKPEVRLRRDTIEWGRAAVPSTENADVLRRRFIYIDIDAIRASGISATDEEKELARLVMERAKEFLRAEGFPEPIVGDSGNGYWLLWAVDIPEENEAENKALHSAFLEYIRVNVPHDGVAFDKAVVNAARVVKLFGTVARKGNVASPERPHRFSRLLSVPAPLEQISVESLQQIKEKVSKKPETSRSQDIDVRAVIDAWGDEEYHEKTLNDGKTLFEFVRCPMNHEHTNSSAYVLQFSNGTVIAGCHHDGCIELGFNGSVRGWHLLRARKEKDYEMPLSFSEKIKAWWESKDKRRHQEDIAELFVNEYKDQLCYVPEENEWREYNGSFWAIDPHNGRVTLMAFLNAVIDVIATATMPEGLTKKDQADWKANKDKWLGWATGLNNARSQDGVLTEAREKAGVSLSQFDTDDWLLNCKNYTVDLRNGDALPHNPNDYITMMVPVNYNPAAKYDRWDRFLTETVGRPEFVHFLQKEMGYCITGSTEEEIILVLYGEELAGKSTFYEPVMLVLGVGTDFGYGRYMRLNTLKHAQGEGSTQREDLLRLRGARVVMCSEINKDTKFDTSLTKKVASGETLIARGMYAKKSIEYFPKFKLVIGTNYRPIIPYDDGGSFRRFVVNPFLNRFEGEERRDKKLKLDFMKNPAAQERILAWMVEGCLAWQREGLNDLPREVMRANSAYRMSQNLLGDFLEDYCIKDAQIDKDNPDARLTNMLTKFNDAREYYGGDRMTANTFGKYMKGAGFKSQKAKEKGTQAPYTYYTDVRLKTNREITNGCDFFALVDKEGKDEPETPAVDLPIFRSQNSENIPFPKPPTKEKSEKGTTRSLGKVYENGPFLISGTYNIDQAQVAQAIRDVLTQFKDARSSKTQTYGLANLANLTAATIRRHHPEWMSYDIEALILKIAESDALIQELTIGKVLPDEM
jgi:P4 family phage/plasmid primase-like protien